MNGLQFDYPTSYILFCALLGILYAIVLYYKDTRWSDKSRFLPWFLGILRAVAVFILAVLLLSPFLTYFEDKTEDPILLLAVDDSESLSLTPDSVLEDLQGLPLEIENRLAEFDHIQLKFGENVQPLDSMSFEEPKTNISSVLDYVQKDLRGRNVGGVILVSDGLYNLGQNPAYALSGLNTPIFPIALGDTSKRKDLSLVEVFHNDIAYKGDKFVVQVDCKAISCKGSTSSLSIYSYEGNNPKRVDQKQMGIDDESYFQTFEFLVDAKKEGVQKFLVSAESLQGETTTSNNSQVFYIDIIDARKKILIAGGAPHPDITAIKQSLTNNDQYEVDIVLPRDKLNSLESYDLVILHQLPFKKSKAGFLDDLMESSIPKLFITGLETNFATFNEVQNSLRINPKRGNANAVTPKFNPNFNVFTYSEESAESLAKYPPLETVFAEFNVTSGGQSLFYQKIGDVDTEYPLVLTGRTTENIRTAYLLGEGFWRWRLYEYGREEEKEPANELLSQIVQYLSVSDDKRRFRTQMGKNVYDESESLTLRAEFYNQNYQLINDPDAFLEVESGAGESYQYTLGKENNYYTLNLGFLPKGEYNYTAYLNEDGERFTSSGRFVVKEIQLELFKTRADHNLMQLLARETGGHMIQLDSLAKGLEKIRSSETAKPILYSQPTTRSLINLTWVFALLIALLAIEWFIRRWVGSY